jgi:anti-anti-sigma factor
MFSVTSNSLNDVSVIAVTGRIDANSSADLESFVIQIINAGTYRLVLDLSNISFISSSGLRVILTLAKNVEPRGGFVRLCGLRPLIQEIFDISGFSQVFTITRSVNEAIS